MSLPVDSRANTPTEGQTPPEKLRWKSLIEVESKHDTHRENLDLLVRLLAPSFYEAKLGNYSYRILEDATVLPTISTKSYYKSSNPFLRNSDEMKISIVEGKKHHLTHKTAVRRLGPIIIRTEDSTKAQNRNTLLPLLKEYEHVGDVRNSRYSIRVLETNTMRVFQISIDDDQRIDPSDNKNLTQSPTIQMEVEYEGKYLGADDVKSEIRNGNDRIIDNEIAPAIQRLYSHLIDQARRQKNGDIDIWPSDRKITHFQTAETTVFPSATSPQAPSE